MKIRNKLLITIIPSLLLSVILISSIEMFVAEDELKKQINEKIERIAEDKQNQIQNILIEYEQDLESLKNIPGFKESLFQYQQRGNNSDKQSLDQILQNYFFTHKDLNHISVYGQDGQLVSIFPNSDEFNVHNYKLINQARTSNYISMEKQDDYVVLHFITKIIYDNQIIGFLISDVEPSVITSITSDYRNIGETGETLLAQRLPSGDSIIIASLRLENEAQLNKIISKNDLYLPINHALLGHQTTFTGAIDYRGETVFASTKLIPKTGWGLVVKIDQMEGLAPITNLRNQMIFIIFAISIVSTIVSILITNRISVPISLIKNRADNLTSGDFSQPIVYEADDELGDLASHLEKMRLSIIKVNDKIRENEKKYRELYDNLPDMCRTINVDGVILNCNSTYAKSLGYSKEEVIGSSIFSHTPKEHMNVKRNSFEQWKKTGVVKNNFVWMKKKDGTTFPALLSAANLYDSAGNLIGSNTIIKDISELEKIKKLLNETKEKIKTEKFVALGQLASGIAHDFKNPLSVIQNSIEILGSLKFDKEDTAKKAIHEFFNFTHFKYFFLVRNFFILILHRIWF